MSDVDGKDPESTFRCRKCRIRLFSSDQLELHAFVDQDLELGKMGFGQQLDTSRYEKCSSWFLRDDHMLSWIIESVEQAQWTEGKIYCPKCKGRIGAFDFIHGIQCNCGKFVIPAIWIQKSRVDHILPKSQLMNLSIRKPVSTKLSVTNNCSNISDMNDTEMGLNDGNVHGLGNISWSCDTCLHHIEDKNEKQESFYDNGQSAFLPCSSCLDFCEESSYNSCVHSKQCLKMRYLHEPQAGEGQTPSSSRTGTCSSNVDHPVASNNSSSEAAHVKCKHENLPTYKSKRIIKGHRQTRSPEDQTLGLQLEVRTESQTSRKGADTNTYSCLSVEEDFEEIVTVKQKDVTPEIPDRHCCSVCLDLLFEPFKCSCDHVFCDPCLRQLNFRTGRKGTMRCPLCRQIVEHVSPASELRNEIRNTYDSNFLRKRERAERRAPYRKWPLPSSRGPSQRAVSRTQRSVTLPCIICTCLMCACLYSLVVILVLSRLTDGIKIY